MEMCKQLPTQNATISLTQITFWSAKGNNTTCDSPFHQRFPVKLELYISRGCHWLTW